MATSDTTTTTPATKKTYTGGCHCGLIKYTVQLDAPSVTSDDNATSSPSSSLSASKCNCTICHKTGYTGLHTTDADFHLLTPSSQSAVPDYQFGSRSCHHFFCTTCGVHVYGRGSYEYEGQKHEYLSVNLVTVDQDQGLDVSKVKLGYWDGKNDNWMAGRKEAPFPQGAY